MQLTNERNINNYMGHDLSSSVGLYLGLDLGPALGLQFNLGHGYGSYDMITNHGGPSLANLVLGPCIVCTWLNQTCLFPSPTSQSCTPSPVVRVDDENRKSLVLTRLDSFEEYHAGTYQTIFFIIIVTCETNMKARKRQCGFGLIDFSYEGI